MSFLSKKVQLAPSGRLHLGTDQENLVDGVWTIVELDSVSELREWNSGIEDAGSYLIKPLVSGLYLCTGQVSFFNVVANKDYHVAIDRSASSHRCTSYGHASNTDMLTVSVTGFVPMTVDEYVQLKALSGAGVDTVDIEAGSMETFLQIQRVR